MIGAWGTRTRELEICERREGKCESEKGTKQKKQWLENQPGEKLDAGELTAVGELRNGKERFPDLFLTRLRIEPKRQYERKITVK